MSDGHTERLNAALEGRYRIDRKLGEGGMATVYLAEDLKHHRKVAVKVLRPELAATMGPERFLREIQVAAKLSHPHILPLYDSGEAEGFLYYVMPYVEDESLEDRLKREHQLPIGDALQIAIDVAGALSYAHDQGLVHRDIKPGNIMLTRGLAVVTDFGICRALNVAGAERLTQTGSSLGTPAYMSPEQWDEAGEVDGRADIYALGCTLYEMLVGQPPFSGTTAMAIMARHSLEVVPRPSVQRHTIDPYLESVILKSLSKTPADRYRTAEKFAKELERSTLTSQGIALPSRAGTRSRLWPSRRRIMVMGAAVLAVGVVGLAVWWQAGSSLAGIFGSAAVPTSSSIGERTGMAGGGLPAHRVVVLYFDDVSRDPSLGYLADGLTEALIDELSLVPALDVVSKNGSLQFRGADLPHDSIARAVRAGTVVGGTVEQVGDRVRVNVVLADGESGAEFRRGNFERPSVDLFAMQADLAQEVAGLLREWLGEEIGLRSGRQETESVAAWALLQRGERARKEGEAGLLENDLGAFVTAFLAADSLLAEAEREDPAWARPPNLRAHLARRWAQLSAADPLEAAEWIEQGFGHVERSLALDPTNAEAFETRGMLRYLKWALSLESDPTAADDLLRTAEEDLNASVRYDPTRANSWNVLSIIHSEKPNLIDAKIAARRAYEEDAYLRAADQVLWRLYTTSYDLEQFPDAVQYCAEGRRRFPEDPQFLECELWLLASRAQEPDVDRAWEILSRFEELSPPQSRERDRLRGQILVGGVLARAGLADSANSVFLTARTGPDVDPTEELLGIEAVFRIQMGDEDEAIRLIKIYLTASPEHRAGWRWTSHWWWREIQDNAEFQQLVGSGGRAP